MLSLSPGLSLTSLPPYGGKVHFDFRLGSVPSPFVSSISTGSIVVMSDGTLAWEQENLLEWSEDISQSEWATGGGGSKSGTDTVVFPNDDFLTTFHQSVTTMVGPTYTFVVEVNGPAGQTVTLRAIDKPSFLTASSKTITFTGSPQTETLTHVVADGETSVNFGFVSNNEAVTFTATKFHVYRSPTANSTYLKTTSSVEFGHSPTHRYNGTKWENVGRFIDTSSRANKLFYSFGTDQYTIEVSANQVESATTLLGLPFSQVTSTATSGRVQKNLTTPDDSNPVYFGVLLEKEESSTNTQIRIDLINGTAVGGGIVVDLSDGSEVSATATRRGIEDWGLFWFVWVSVDNNGTGNTLGAFSVYPENGGTGTITIGASQVAYDESGPGDIIITTGAQVTRGAMTLGVSGSEEMLRFIGEQPFDGNITVEFTHLEKQIGVGSQILYISDNSTSDIINIGVDAINRVFGSVTSSSVNQGSPTATTALVFGADAKVQFQIASDDLALKVDDQALQTDTTATISSNLTRADVFSSYVPNGWYYGYLQSITVERGDRI